MGPKQGDVSSFLINGMYAYCHILEITLFFYREMRAMAAIQFNRRSNLERRRSQSHPDDERRRSDRREQPYNGYVLMIGEEGFDAFSLFVMLPIALVLAAAFIISFMMAY